MAKIQTRARAVDMLGRQQIAGIQNALIEIFKNSHDAYADNVKVDYFEDYTDDGQSYLLIRDDGIGMTRDEFERNWLVLGTDNKVKVNGLKQQFCPRGKKIRPITGEKGIGRLAIALLGQQTLVITKASHERDNDEMVVALIHWGFFEIPSLNISDIDIPVITVPTGRLPSKSEIKILRRRLISCARRIQEDNPNTSTTELIEEINSFQPDLETMFEFLEYREDAHLDLVSHDSGTFFLVGPANVTIKADLEEEEEEKDYGFRKQLLGFTDEVFSDTNSSQIHTTFCRWRRGDIFGDELLEPKTFFTREELENRTDHFFQGQVDEYGQLKGSLRVYNEVYDPVSIPWKGGQGQRTKCGPFSVIFGYVMGRQSESMLSPDEFQALNSKLDNIGGMYIYFDGIRVLPYGDHSFDWLEVEKRRNKGAGYYFFSFRRMFGAVLLNRTVNENLTEKAGREGFQRNVAYRQLRSILIEILAYLAAEFFRDKGTNTELFERTQLEFRRRAQALERQQKRTRGKRKKFSLTLVGVLSDLRSGRIELEVADLKTRTIRRMSANAKLDNPDIAATSLIQMERQARENLANLRNKSTCRRPSGVALGRELQRDWEDYLEKIEEVEVSVFQPFEQALGDAMFSIAEQARIQIDQRIRLQENLNAVASHQQDNLALASKNVRSTANDTRNTVLEITNKAKAELKETISKIESDLHRTSLNELNSKQVEHLRARWEDQVNLVEKKHHEALMSVRDILAAISENLKVGSEEPAQAIQAMEERILALEEQADEDFEMVQLGLAVAIINHEFVASIRQIRKNIKEIGGVSRRSPSLKPLYNSIKSNFEHLDGHLNLFTPLERRLHRNSQTISGKKIHKYCVDLFSNRIKRHRIEFRASETFLSSSLSCYASTLYPAVVNIVDNAIFWLSTQKKPRRLELDADTRGLFISNNGPFNRVARCRASV